jgi:ribose 1,5-bisphosphokinase
VTAPPEILVRRLTERGRETADDVAKRLARDVVIPDGVPVEIVMNDRTPAEAADRFVAALNRAALSVPPG